MAFQTSVIIQPQYVGIASAALTLIVSASGTTGVAVPGLTQISLWTCRFTNNSAAPVTLKVFRVPSGAAADAAHVVVNTITIPVATTQNPYFEWSPRYQLSQGDAIWAIASVASVLVVTGDGGITVG